MSNEESAAVGTANGVSMPDLTGSSNPKVAVKRPQGTSNGKARDKPTAKKGTGKKGKLAEAALPTTRSGKSRKPKVERPYPRLELREAVKVPLEIRRKHGGNPWSPEEVRTAVNYSKGDRFYYLTTSARNFGLTEGTSRSPEISLTALGRRLAFAETPVEEADTRREAFLNVPIFREVLEYYNGSQLPEMKYLGNTLENKFGLDPSIHEEFADLFRKNCEYVDLKEGVPGRPAGRATATKVKDSLAASSNDFVTVAEPEEDTGLVCFVAMPFTEKHDEHRPGFFTEVLNQIIAPAGRKAGFKVVTARKQGSDIIHATIINGLLDADLVIADLTEHNPNVLFELGIRMAEDKPVALIRATGTKPIFDVDQMLRVEEYNPNLWASSVEIDLPKIADHIAGSWNDRDSRKTYMKILRDKKPDA